MAHSSAQSLVWSAMVAGVAAIAIAIAITMMATAAIVMTAVIMIVVVITITAGVRTGNSALLRRRWLTTLVKRSKPPPCSKPIPLLVLGRVEFPEVDGLAVGRERDVDIPPGGIGIWADTMRGTDQLDGRRGVAD